MNILCSESLDHERNAEQNVSLRYYTPQAILTTETSL
jgi:hypothetical protein